MTRFLTATFTYLMLTFSAQAGEMQKLTVFLDWFINPDHGPLIVADAKGYFKDEGLDVTMIEPADPNDPPKLVAAGQGDIAISYQPQLHIFADIFLKQFARRQQVEVEVLFQDRQPTGVGQAAQ